MCVIFKSLEKIFFQQIYVPLQTEIDMDWSEVALFMIDWKTFYRKASQ